MSSRAAAWKCSLQPLLHLPERDFPSTLYALPCDESVGESSSSDVHIPLDIVFPKGEEKQSVLKYLIDGYSRWIMEKTKQNKISFLITAREDGLIFKFAIITAERYAEDGIPEWEAYEVSQEKYALELKGLEFALCLNGKLGDEESLLNMARVALCVDLESSSVILAHKSEAASKISLSEFAHELETILNHERCEHESNFFWKRELESFVGLGDIQFPALSCTRSLDVPSSPSHTQTTLDLQITWEQLENISQQFGLRSGISVIRAAFAYTLTEFMETDRIILGDQDLTDVAQEDSPKAVPVIVGMQDTSEDLLRRIEEFDRRASAIRSLSSQKLREILKGSPAQSPYNAVFTYHQREVPENNPESLLNMASEFHEAPIELVVQRSHQDSPLCTLSPRGALLDSAHSEAVLKQIDALVTAMCSAPTEKIHDLAQTFPKELLSIHSPDVSDEVRKAPSLSPAHWVDHWASSNPSWIGLEIIDEISESNAVSRKWTYQDLSEMSDQLCSWFVQRGWANRSIAVCLDRSFMSYCLVLGIWKSNNCYVPIAEDLPEARQLFLLSDSGATAFFVDSKVSKNLLSPENCEVIDIDTIDFINDSNIVQNGYSVNAKPSDDCYLLYTSGSTGAPKGVLVSRGNLSAFTEAQSDYICRDVPDTQKLKGAGGYLAHASRAFDVHICEMVLGWRHGLRLVTGQRNMLLDNLFLVLRRFKITHAGFVPSLLEHAGVSAESLPDLRYLGVGGEKISETIIERFVGKQSISLVNAYGPTEATIGFTSHTVKPWSTVRNIGTAVGNITVHVLEADSPNYVKRGQAGELCVTGDLVANGYHRRPDATGFTVHHGQRMYRTGDIVRLMANNCIEYLGRRDSQAKIRGQRLELEEVSIVIRRCAGFPVNVTSMVTPSPITKRPQLVAFLSPSGDQSDSSSAEVTFMKDRYQEWIPRILESCRVELPAYMVPSILLPVSSIPIQISGKADNRRLVALYESIPISDLLLKPGAEVAIDPGPTVELEDADLTPEEIQIRDIICSQIDIGQSSVTRTTSIFQLGIDSLGALGIAAKMRHAGYMCSAADVLSKATLEQLALLPRSDISLGNGGKESFLENHKAEALRRLEQIDHDFRNSQTQIPNSSISVVRPCLPLQESIVSNSLGSTTPLYVNHIMCRLGKGIKLTNLKLAFEDLMQHNEIMRTCFEVVDNKILQLVLKPRTVTLPWDEVIVSDEKVARDIFDMRRDNIASKIIQGINGEPPFHVLAASSINESDPGWLMLSIHHSIFDGASMSIFLKQLHHHYTGDAAICANDLSPLYQYLIADAQADTEDFWVGHLSGYLPGIIEDEEGYDNSYSLITKALPFKLSSISKIASQASSTTPIVVETVFAIVLAECLGQKDLIFGRVMNGRSIPVEAVEEMLIPLVTTVPGRFRLPSSGSSLLEQIKIHTHAMLESLPYQNTPLRAIQRYTGVDGPLFNTLISYIVNESRAPWNDMLTEMDSVMPADYPLALEVQAEPDTDTITLRLRIATALSSKGRYGSFVDRIFDLLNDLVMDGDVAIDTTRSFVKSETKKITWDETQWTEGERKIRQAVTEVTGLSESDVSKNASFFSLGIDSVISIHLARCLRQNNIEVSPSDILRYASVGALHNFLEKPRAVSSEPKNLERSFEEEDLSAELLHSDDEILETYLCTPLQTAMIAECLSSGGKGYLHHHAVVLSESIDLEKLLSTWKITAENTDILRTSFHRRGSENQFYAAVHKYPLVQWSHQQSVESLPHAIESLSQNAAYPDIESFQKPPWKVTILTGSCQQLMVVTMHHSLYDGFSLPLLFMSLEKSYLGHAENLGSFAPVARKITFEQQSSIKFWSDVVAGYQYSGLPFTQPSAQPNLQRAEVKIQTSVPELQRLCGEMDVTLQTVALLAFGCSLMPIIGQRDVVFGHVVSGRNLDIDSSMTVIGPLFNTVPFRLKLQSTHQSVQSVLQDIQHFSINSQPFHHAPLSLVQKDWRGSKEGSASSLFDALFSFNKSTKLDSSSIYEPYEASGHTDIPHHRLNVEIDQSSESLVIRAISRDLLSEENALQSWIHNLARGIETIISSRNLPAVDILPEIKLLPMVTKAVSKTNEPCPDSSVIETYVEGLKLILSKITKTSPENIHESNSVFSLGLDSILALDVSSQCRKAGLEISVGEILQGETIQGIARLASKKLARSSESAASNQLEKFYIQPDLRSKALSMLSLSNEEVEAVIPCLSGQSFYIASWLRSQRQLWEFTFAFKSHVRIEVDRLQFAWKMLQERHSPLRITFAAISPDQIVQIVRTRPESQVQIEKASGDLQVTIQGLITNIRRESSDLFTPPIRLRLVQHAESDVLLLTLHHALYDARTISILIRDLEALYQNTILNESSSFTSFVLDMQQKYQSGFADDYWIEEFSMGQRTLLGTRSDNELAPSSVQSSHAIFPPAFDVVEKQCLEKNISIPSLMILTVARSLARTTNVSHPTLGIFQNGRSNDYPGIQDLAGPVINMLPLVVSDALGSPSREALVAMQQKLAQRSLYDQTDLRTLHAKMKTLGHDIEFNLIVNILWGQVDSTPEKEMDSIFAPFSLESDTKLDPEVSMDLVMRETPVDGFDWKTLPGVNSIYLEIRYDEKLNALVWKLDYASESLAKQEAEEFLKQLEDDMKTILEGI